MASASANLSGCLAPFLAATLVAMYDWRFSLNFAGILSAVVAFLAYTTLVNSPTEIGLKSFDRPTVSNGKTKENKSPDASKSNKSPKVTNNTSPMVRLLRSPFIWVISICYLIVSCLKTSVTDWGQLYLMNDCKQSSLVGK